MINREVVRRVLRKLGVDEWLIHTVIALYTEACTVVRTYAVLSESFEVKVGLHQGSVQHPLMLASVMDVVSREARSGLTSELLYADVSTYGTNNGAFWWLNGELSFLTTD